MKRIIREWLKSHGASTGELECFDAQSLPHTAHYVSSCVDYFKTREAANEAYAEYGKAKFRAEVALSGYKKALEVKDRAYEVRAGAIIEIRERMVT